MNRRRRKARERLLTAVALIVLVAGSVWVFVRLGTGTTIDESLQLGAGAVDVPVSPSRMPFANGTNKTGETSSTPPTDSPGESAPDDPPSASEPVSPPPEAPSTPGQSPRELPAEVAPPTAALLETAKSAYARGDLLAARSAYSRLWRMELEVDTRALVREKAEQIALDTILGSRMVPGDPLVERYVVDAGDLLVKIASANKVPVGVLARINGLADPNRIQIGQTLKIIKGPFRAVVDKSAFTLDVYLGDTFVRQFKVGLGADDSTPTGEWQVSTKLKNPTYYPPRGGPIIAADDPKNPLGEHWIGLRGISGEALGQERYGIHGTIEPETIGKNASLGCVRLLNEDVEQLYGYLIEQHSTVTVKGGITRAGS